MTRRSGMTLVEVLVAIFIMAIGLLALLTLFPLGALNMAQAIKDQRVAEAGRNAAAGADMTFEDNNGNRWTLRTDPTVQNALVNPGTSPGFGQLPNLAASGTARTYPVLVDPVGTQANMGWVAPLGAAYPGLPRTSLNALSGASGVTLARWTTLLDDVTFDENGVPDLTYTNVQREGRYSWAWLVQADRASSASQGIVNVTVLVFSGRSLDLSAASGTLGALEENSYVANFGQDSTGAQTPRVINIQWASTQPRPDLRANSWILDGTLNINGGTASPNHAAFYRVLNVTDVATPAGNGNSQMDVEVQEDLQSTGAGNVIVFNKLVEVIQRLLN